MSKRKLDTSTLPIDSESSKTPRTMEELIEFTTKLPASVIATDNNLFQKLTSKSFNKRLESRKTKDPEYANFYNKGFAIANMAVNPSNVENYYKLYNDTTSSSYTRTNKPRALMTSSSSSRSSPRSSSLRPSPSSRSSPSLRPSSSSSSLRPKGDKKLRITAITALCLCHGSIMVEISDSPYLNVKRKNCPSFPKIKEDTYRNGTTLHTITDKDITFDYLTIPFNGRYSNLGSCPGFPVIKAPNYAFNKQCIVEYETKLLLEEVADETPTSCNNFLLACDTKTVKLKMREVDSTKIHELSQNDRDTCFYLTNHTDTPCKSLLNKSYYSKEIDTVTVETSKFDAGRFILLYKIVDEETGDITVEKFAILSPEYKEEIARFEKMFYGSDIVRAYNTLLLDLIKEDSSELGKIFTTTTENIFKFIDYTKVFINGGSRFVMENPDIRFFDGSCNSITTYVDASGTRKSYTDTTNSDTVDVLKKIHDYLLDKGANGESVLGGNTRFKKTHPKNKTKRKSIKRANYF